MFIKNYLLKQFVSAHIRSWKIHKRSSMFLNVKTFSGLPHFISARGAPATSVGVLGSHPTGVIDCFEIDIVNKTLRCTDTFQAGVTRLH